MACWPGKQAGAPETREASLSVAQQQKVELAKALSIDADVSVMAGRKLSRHSPWAAANIRILERPTRGVDAGTNREISALILNPKEQGKCVLTKSSDLPEVPGINNSILVMSNGPTRSLPLTI